MSIINFRQKKKLRLGARSKASELHDRMLALAGNPESLKDFIKDNDLDDKLYEIILESDIYLDNKKDDHDR